jgi:competence protein CoiA
MRFALQNSLRIEASPYQKGQCPACFVDVLAKCGTKRIWHWAHKAKAKCDHWWENETDWHRNWKERFPNDWQEAVVRGTNGELHFADVRTPGGLVVEFQHSTLCEQEQEEREEFYGQMVWVLDGSQGDQGYGKLIENIRFWSERAFDTKHLGHKFNPLLAKITKRWLLARRPVFVDFGDDALWSISIRRDGWAKYALQVSKDDFVRSIQNDSDPIIRLSPW